VCVALSPDGELVTPFIAKANALGLKEIS